MNKIILLTIITVALLSAGCSKVDSTNSPQQNNQSPSESSNDTVPKSPGKTTPPASTTTSETIDYSQYVKKTWTKKEDTNYSLKEKVYFSISKIENGKITGKFSAESFDQADKNLPFFVSDFEGKIYKNAAECQYNDSKGNHGNLELVFKDHDEMEATITIIDKSNTTIQPPEGTFEFAPDNIKNIKYFRPIESQSFMINLNSWGNVKFVSGKLETGNHIPTVFYLTNQDGDILYDFINVENFPYSVDVKAVSFEDVTKDGLKDIIIIVVDNYNGAGGHIANVYFQKADGSFTNDYKLNQEINDSGNNKDVKSVTNYLSQKF